MGKYTIHQAKTQLSKLIREALNGEDVVITNRDVPVVKLQVVDQPHRRLGFLKGKISISGDFNDSIKDFEDFE